MAKVKNDAPKVIANPEPGMQTYKVWARYDLPAFGNMPTPVGVKFSGWVEFTVEVVDYQDLRNEELKRLALVKGARKEGLSVFVMLLPEQWDNIPDLPSNEPVEE